MAEKDLIPFTQRPEGERRLLNQRGGRARTQVKKDAAKFRELKKRMAKQGMKSEDAQWLLTRLENRDAMAGDILMYLEEIKETCHPSQKIALANTMKEVAKFTHGEKIKTENVNINVNVSIEEWEKRLIGDNSEDKS